MHEPPLTTYRCERCGGRFTERWRAIPPRYCGGCEAEMRRLARRDRQGRPARKGRGITPSLHRPPRGVPRKG